jgi:hypothetical protein
MDFKKAKLNPAAVFKSPQEVFSSQELSLEQKIEIPSAMGTGREVDGSRGGRKHAWPATQTAPADSRRSARPQLLAGYRALEPQQNLRTGPQ